MGCQSSHGLNWFEGACITIQGKMMFSLMGDMECTICISSEKKFMVFLYKH